MARLKLNKKKHISALSGDTTKRDKVRKDSSIFGGEDKNVILDGSIPILRLPKGRPDTFFLVLCVLIIALGSILSFSAGSAYSLTFAGNGFTYFINHLKHLFIGFICACGAYWSTHPKRIRRISVLFYIGCIILLILIFPFGVEGGGAKRWLMVRGLTIQPSELAKTAIILVMSLYLTKHERFVNSGLNRYSFLHGLLIPSLSFILVSVLVYFEHHFSGIIIICAIGIGVLFIGGTHIVWLCTTGFLGLGLGFLISKTDYAMDRIKGFLDKSSNQLEGNWQSTQGLYAIGSGGLFGVGLGESSMKYGYVSQPQNDFVFTIICEELGFFGATTILLLFLALVIRGVILGLHAADKFSALVILGLSFKLAIHVILNVGVVSGVLPNTGISLPFISTGGSATLSQMVDMGMVLGLSRYCTQKK